MSAQRKTRVEIFRAKHASGRSLDAEASERARDTLHGSDPAFDPLHPAVASERQLEEDDAPSTSQVNFMGEATCCVSSFIEAPL